MFGISLLELLIIGIVILIVFGPEKLPEMARTLGKMMGELRKSSDALRREFYNSVYKPAQSDLTNLRSNLVSFKDDFIERQSRDPNCPDYKPPTAEESAPEQAQAADSDEKKDQ
ncbi:MAG: hypothetical protein DCC75_04795 [Proteobacteria bacterium]|nr:MAG: hypothetical protein DCC75_04795 [Pseudomonadota bacterium]